MSPVSAKKRPNKRSARIEFRPTAGQKNRFEQAAALEGLSLTDFLIVSAEEHAMRVLDRHERLSLGEQARGKLFSALVYPPLPNERLLALAARYAEEVKGASE